MVARDIYTNRHNVDLCKKIALTKSLTEVK